MSAMEIRTAEPRQSEGVVDWRHFWLTNVMIDSGKFVPHKIARYNMVTRKDSLTRRLHRLRRMRAGSRPVTITPPPGEALLVMPSKEQERADRLFQRKQEVEKALSEYEAKEHATRALTAKLRAERLAREAKEEAKRDGKKARKRRQKPTGPRDRARNVFTVERISKR